MVAQAMQAQGYAPAASPADRDHARRGRLWRRRGRAARSSTIRSPAVSTAPFYGGYYDPFFRRGLYGRPYYSRFGYYGARSPFYYGWDDPFWGSPFDSPYGGVRAYTVYKSYLDLDIRRQADNASLFEGHAKARSQTDNLGVLVPNLVEAMFTGFPGRSGETVKITVPPATARRLDQSSERG